MDQILIALAGLMGAAGIMLAAAGAHSKPGVGLDSAGYLLADPCRGGDRRQRGHAPGPAAAPARR